MIVAIKASFPSYSNGYRVSEYGEAYILLPKPMKRGPVII